MECCWPGWQCRLQNLTRHDDPLIRHAGKAPLSCRVEFIFQNGRCAPTFVDDCGTELDVLAPPLFRPIDTGGLVATARTLLILSASLISFAEWLL